jgi:hypothetical protein
MIPQLIEDLLLLPQAVSHDRTRLAGCWLRSAAAAEIDESAWGDHR